MTGNGDHFALQTFCSTTLATWSLWTVNFEDNVVWWEFFLRLKKIKFHLIQNVAITCLFAVFFNSECYDNMSICKVFVSWRQTKWFKMRWRNACAWIHSTMATASSADVELKFASQMYYIARPVVPKLLGALGYRTSSTAPVFRKHLPIACLLVWLDKSLGAPVT